MLVLPLNVQHIIYKKLHKLHLSEVHRDIKQNVVKPEQYVLSLKRRFLKTEQCWRSNPDYSPDDNLDPIWNLQRYRKKAIETYTIKLLGSRHYALNKIGNVTYNSVNDDDIVEELRDGTVSMDLYLEKSLCEMRYNYNVSHKYEITNQLRKLSDLALCELHC